jgi:hypothetical protein
MSISKVKAKIEAKIEAKVPGNWQKEKSLAFIRIKASLKYKELTPL